MKLILPELGQVWENRRDGGERLIKKIKDNMLGWQSRGGYSTNSFTTEERTFPNLVIDFKWRLL